MQLHKKVVELLLRLRPSLRRLKPNRKREKEHTTLHSEDIMTTPSSTSPSPPKASFLGISYELRLLIYNKVICLDIDFCLEKASPTSSSNYKSLNERSDVACELPINRLALVCRSVAKEIRSHARLLPSGQHVACIELRARALFLFAVYLRRLPCRVRHFSGLDLEVRLDLPPALPRDRVHQRVQNKIHNLRDTLFHLLHPRKGVLKDAARLKDVRIYLTSTKSKRGTLSDEIADEVEREIRVQAEEENFAYIEPVLVERALHLMWDQR